MFVNWIGTDVILCLMCDIALMDIEIFKHIIYTRGFILGV